MHGNKIKALATIFQFGINQDSSATKATPIAKPIC